MQEGRHDAPVFREATHGTGRTGGGNPGCGTVRSSVCCPDGDDPGSGELAGRRPQGMGRDHHPVLEAAHRGIAVEFHPSLPADYDAVIEDKLEAGTAGDLITCRPFDRSLALHEAGHLADSTTCPAWTASRPSPGRPGRPRRVHNLLRAGGIGALRLPRRPDLLERRRGGVPCLDRGPADACRRAVDSPLPDSGPLASIPWWEVCGANLPAMRAMSPTPLTWGSASTPRAPTGQRAAYS